MPLNPPENTPRITPYLLYEDVSGTMEWLIPRDVADSSLSMFAPFRRRT